MRFSNYLPLLGGAASLLVSLAAASPAPLVDIEKTSVSLDNSAQSLDDGQIKVHLARVDDLIDDKDNNRLLLERTTHIAVNIQLDTDNKALDVNGQRAPLLAADGESQGSVAMNAVKAQSYTLPKDMPSDFYHPDHVDKLVQALSTGIVSLEVRLEVEHVPVDLLGHHVSKAAVAAMSAPNLSLRKIGLYMRLTEVEGKRLMHSKNIYAPIVQLMVASDGPEGKIHKVSTLSVAGRPATTSAAPKTLSSVKGQLKAAAKKASKEGPLSGLRGFMNSMMHQPKTKKPCADAAKGTKGQRKGRPLASDKVKGLRKGKALADQNPHRFGAMSESKHLSQHHNHSSLHRAKSACHAFMRSLRESAVFVAVILVFMVIGAIHVARLLRYWRSSSRPSYEPLASQEGQEKHHLAVAFEPPPYQDENGVAQSLYYPDFANSPVDVLYDASESDDHTDEKTADTHS